MIDEDILEVGAATLDRKVSNFAKENGIGKLEFLSCIPGTLGGAVVMNSGCYNNDISKVLISLRAIDINECVEKEIPREKIKFFYRGCDLDKNLIITSVKLKGKKEKNRRNRKKTKRINREKKIISA